MRLVQWRQPLQCCDPFKYLVVDQGGSVKSGSTVHDAMAYGADRHAVQVMQNHGQCVVVVLWAALLSDTVDMSATHRFQGRRK